MTIPIIKQYTPEEIEQRQKGMNEIFQKLNKLFLNATDTDKIQDTFKKKDNKKLLEELKDFYEGITTIQRVIDNIINIDTLKNTSQNGESDKDFRERKFFSSLEKFCSVQSFDTKSEGKKFENNVKKIVDKYKKDVNNRNKLWGVLEQNNKIC